MGWTATARLDDEAVPATVPANDNAVPGGRVAWYRNYHRYYDPAVGRYTQPDPFLTVTVPSSNAFSRVAGTVVIPPEDAPYAYAGNDPLSRMDPSGERWFYRGRELQRCFFAGISQPPCPCGQKRLAFICTWRRCSGWMWEQEYALGASLNWDLNVCYGSRWWGSPNPSVPGKWTDEPKVIDRYHCVPEDEVKRWNEPHYPPSVGGPGYG